MKNRRSTLILTNLVGVHPKNINTKFEANLCSGSIVYFKRLDSRQNELKMYVISIWSRFKWILSKTDTRRTWTKRQTG